MKLKVVLVSPYSDFKALTDMGHVSFNYLGMLCYGTNQDIVNRAGLSKYFR